MGENICKWSNWQGINFQNIQTTHASQYKKKKNKQTQSKNLNKCLSKEDIQIAKKTHEKMFNITNY